MTRKSKKQRNAEQAIRQQSVRDEAKARHRSTRDDLARVLLWQMIVAAQRRKDAPLALGKLSEAIVGDLDFKGSMSGRAKVSSKTWPIGTPVASSRFGLSGI